MYKLNTKMLDETLVAMGHQDNLLGTNYLRTAVEMYGTGYTLMTKELYPEVARVWGTTPSRCERAIRHSIETAFDRAVDWDGFKMLCGPTNPRTGKLSNGEYIARLARRCREADGQEPVGPTARVLD